MFEDIKLHTDDGGYVTTVKVPKFTPKAKVLNWGIRFFMLHESGEYREVFCYCIPVIK